MLTSFTAAAVDATPFYLWLAKASGTVAIWAATRAQRSEISEPDVEARIQALTLKVRHPWRYRLAQVSRWMR